MTAKISYAGLVLGGGLWYVLAEDILSFVALTSVSVPRPTRWIARLFMSGIETYHGTVIGISVIRMTQYNQSLYGIGNDASILGKLRARQNNSDMLSNESFYRRGCDDTKACKA